jgi:hypothetical protein
MNQLLRRLNPGLRHLDEVSVTHIMINNTPAASNLDRSPDASLRNTRDS